MIRSKPSCSACRAWATGSLLPSAATDTVRPNRTPINCFEPGPPRAYSGARHGPLYRVAPHERPDETDALGRAFLLAMTEAVLALDAPTDAVATPDFEAFFREHHERLFRALWLMTRNRHEAGDW